MHDFDTLDEYTDHGGMVDHMVDGEYVSTAVNNVFGGHDYYDAHDHLFARTEPDGHGGTDAIDAEGHALLHTEPNAAHGKDLYGGDEHFIGETQPNVFGGHDLLSADHALLASDLPLGHGLHDVMSYADPLAHIQDYQVPGLDLTR